MGSLILILAETEADAKASARHLRGERRAHFGLVDGFMGMTEASEVAVAVVGAHEALARVTIQQFAAWGAISRIVSIGPCESRTEWIAPSDTIVASACLRGDEDRFRSAVEQAIVTGSTSPIWQGIVRPDERLVAATCSATQKSMPDKLCQLKVRTATVGSLGRPTQVVRCALGDAALGGVDAVDTTAWGIVDEARSRGVPAMVVRYASRGPGGAFAAEFARMENSWIRGAGAVAYQAAAVDPRVLLAKVF